jgi:tetratricopeptide (TPR) repeat protein
MAKRVKKTKKRLKKKIVSQNPLGLLVLFSLLFSSLLISLFPGSVFDQSKIKLIKNPDDVTSRLTIIESLLSTGQFNDARTELISLRTQNNKQVLGASTQIDNLWQKYQENNPQELNKLISFWESVVNKTPTYLNGWVYLGYYQYQLGKTEEAKESINQALLIDPNFESTKELQKYLISSY